MTPERVLEIPPLVLDQRARKRYFADGFLAVPGHVGAAWLARLRAVVAAKIEESRGLAASDEQFDLAPDHCAEKPSIRRLRKAVDQHPELWAFARDPAVVDLVADLLGPDLRFHSSKLNFKWSQGGDAVGSLFDQFDGDGRWTGALAERDVATLRPDTATELCGPAGTVVLPHCRVVATARPRTTRRGCGPCC